MTRIAPRIVLAAALAIATAAPVAAQNRIAPPALQFLPPDLAPRDLCYQPKTDMPALREAPGRDDTLTDRMRIRYLTRDIRNYRKIDADRYFDFIDALITRRAAIDEEFAGIEETLERIELHLQAGRLDSLANRGLVQRLAGDIASLNNTQSVQVAQYIRTGVGVPPDPTLAQSLLRAAAHEGNARALMEIARLALQGELVEGWNAPLDLTVTMAFGGMLGELTPGVCARAERIAQHYLRGDIVEANPDIAYAWRRFAADMGGAEAAWRIVEYHLSAPPERKDNATLRYYLKRAVDLGLTVPDKQMDRIATSGAVSEEELRAILGENHDHTGPRAERSVVPYLELTVNVDAEIADEDGLYLDYLREIATMPEAPGAIFTDLAAELGVREGRWAAEAAIIEVLEEAARRGDAEGMTRLAERLIRYRDDPAQLNRAENLLIRAAERHRYAPAFQRLDALYRCQAPAAPMMAEAGLWAMQYGTTRHAHVTMSATDLIGLDPYREPETIAQIQSQALEGRPNAVAEQAQYIQSGALASETALRVWADRLDRSDQSLEAFVELDFELATSPSERAQAVELFRRVYLNNGVTTALDLAIALIEDHARDPETADEIVRLLVQASNRGEGAAIRLLSRLGDPDWSPRTVFETYAPIIEARGDFLALMYAIPFLEDRAKVDDYIDRAVSLMNCGTKDADELGDAHATWQDAQGSYHWRRVGLSFENGHVLSKLRLSDAQMGYFDKGRAPSAQDIAARAAADGEPLAHRRLFRMTADEGITSYDPDAAVTHLLTGIGVGDTAWALRAYRKAGDTVRRGVERNHDIAALYRDAAQAGDPEARYSLGMLLREGAQDADALTRSARWLEAAAQSGHDEAMVEYAFALGFGLGVPRDAETALVWLDRAAAAHNPDAQPLAAKIRLSRLMEPEG